MECNLFYIVFSPPFILFGVVTDVFNELVLRYVHGSLFQVSMVLGDSCTYVCWSVCVYWNWNERTTYEGTTCSAPWRPDSCAGFTWFWIFRTTTIWPKLFIYLFIYPPLPDLYRQSCWSDVYRFTFFPYIKKKLGSSSFLVRNPTWFLQGHPFFLLHDVCSLLVREINFVLVSYRIMYWLKIIYIMRGLQSLRNNPIFFIY